ncbi:Protein transport protein sec1, partial [Zancudomyces culisetae]
MYPETSRQIAESIQKELDKLEKGNEKGDDKKGTGKNKGVLLVVDRSVDLLAPLLHEFTYEAMAMDLAEEQIETDNKMRRKYNYSVDLANGQTEPRSMELGNNGSGGEDAVWREYRYQHISDAQGRLLKEVEKFAQSNKAIADFQSGGEGKANLTMVRDVVGAMPQFKAQMAIYGAHVNLMQRCMRRFNGDKLADLAIIEQNLVMGTTPENQKYVDGGLDIGQYLSSSNPKMNKLRLLLIFLLTNPRLTQTDRVKLLERASLSGDARSAVDGLDSIVPVSVANELREKIVAGCKKSKLTLSNVISTSKLWGSDSKKRGDSKAKDDDEVEETPYEVSRYVTALKYITEAVLSGHIDSSILKKAGAPSHRRAGGMF